MTRLISIFSRHPFPGLAIFLILFFIPSCAPVQKTTGIANPASVNCSDKGGSLKILKNPSGGEYGVCVFAGDKQCEEWAMFRNECPVGGVSIKALKTPASIYCVITGGKYEPSTDSCALSSGKTCPAEKWFIGGCVG